MPTKCLVCNVNFKSDLLIVNENLCQVYQNIFDTFCDYFLLNICKQENPFNFHNDVLPFCSECREIVVKLCLYKSQVVTIQKKITKTVGIVAKLIIDSTLAASAERVNQSNQDNCDEEKYDKSCTPLTATVMSTEDVDEEVCQKISRFRKSIIKKYSPFVNLEKVERIMKIPSNRSCSYENDENPLTYNQLGHADVGSSDDAPSLEFDGPTLEEHLEDCVENMVTSFSDEDSQGRETDKDQVLEEITLNPKNDESIPADDDDSNTKMLDNLGIVKPPELSSISLIEQIRSKSQQLMEDVSRSELFLYFGRWPVQRKGCLFHCLTCGATLINPKCLFSHMKQVHRDPRTFSCSKCKVEISNENYFISHQLNVHPDTILVGEVIACGHGKFLYDGRWFFEEQENGFQCSLCGKEEESHDGILSHLQTHKDASLRMKLGQSRKKFECGICELNFKTFEEKQNHQINLHPRRCRCCGQPADPSIQNSQYYLCKSCRETKLKEAETSFTCPLCTKKYKQKSKFLHHFNSVHSEALVMSEVIECGNLNLLVDGSWLFLKNEEDAGFQCCFCCDRTIDRESIRQHLANHPGHMCEVCGFLMKNEAALNRHYVTHHQYSEDDLKSGKFYSRGIKYAHYESQVDEAGIENGFKCSECDFVGQDHSQMSTHIFVHGRNKDKKELNNRKTFEGADGVFIYGGKWKFKNEHNGKFQCLTCGYVANSQKYVTHHIRDLHETVGQRLINGDISQEDVEYLARCVGTYSVKEFNFVSSCSRTWFFTLRRMLGNTTFENGYFDPDLDYATHVEILWDAKQWQK